MKKLLLSSFLATSMFAFAYTQVDIENANYLSEKRIITQQSTTDGYRLDDTITRAEVVGMGLKLKGTALPEGYQCKGYFSDTTKNDWICRAIELAADMELISRTNTKFRPQEKITRAEAFAIIYKSSGLSGSPENYHFFTEEGEAWQKELLYKIYNSGLEVSPVIKDNVGPSIRYSWSPDKQATRGDIFEFSSKILQRGNGNSDISKNVTNLITVIDGDTIHFNDMKIRMIGLDAPESNNSRYGYAECFGPESKEHLEKLLKNATEITLEKDATQGEIDMYGRTLAYVIADGVNINTRMIADGFGFEETYNNKIYKYQNEHKNAELNAKNNDFGLWSSTTCGGNRKKGTIAEQNNNTNTNTTNAGTYTCGTKTYCSQMITCEEAKYFLNQCALTRLDSDSDGIPCEAICN